MATKWGMTRDEARIAFKLGGWVQVKSDPFGTAQAELLMIHKKSATVRVRGTTVPRDVKLADMRPQHMIRDEMAKQTAKESTMPPDIAPRPLATNGRAALLNGHSGTDRPAEPPPLTGELAAVISFFSKVKDAKDNMESATATLAKAEKQVFEYEELLREAKKERDQLKVLHGGFAALLKGLPPTVLDLMK